MRWPFVSSKKYEKLLRDNIYSIGVLKKDILVLEEQRINARRLAKQEAFAEYREWIVDLNYNLFNTHDGLLRQRLYGALTDGTHKFDPKEIKE